ncbi:MAG: pilus assembly protein N-terminal domain-containing protein [Lautropia sp.]|nr:pilus assembly protein N-terminal domain-containing protein [Lautropia sp.]
MIRKNASSVATAPVHPRAMWRTRIVAAAIALLPLQAAALELRSPDTPDAAPASKAQVTVTTARNQPATTRISRKAEQASSASAASPAVRKAAPAEGVRTHSSRARATSVDNQATAVKDESITVAVGQAHLLDVGTVKRVAVGNGRVLQVNALDHRQLLLLPEAVGESTLHLWLPDGQLRRYLVQVTASNSPRLADEINQMLGAGNGVFARAMGDKVVIEGDNPTEEGAWRVAEIVKRYPEVVNLSARRGFERMINLEVKMIEIGRNALQQLGVRWSQSANGPSFGVVGDFKRSDAFVNGTGLAASTGYPVGVPVGPFATAASVAFSLQSMIDLMLQNGEAVLLAEPRLSTRSGGKARFVAGGELPIPMMSANGAANVDFKEYGVRFEVEPTINAQGMISANLHTEISSINQEVKVMDVPGLRKQSADAEVNLRPGETLVIAGMISSEMSNAVDKVPGLGNLPIIGNLFKSRRFQKRETEMVVLITPRVAEQGQLLADPRGEALQKRAVSLQKFGMME